MRATLFFAMLSRGRTVERRRNFGAFYELARVAFVPHMSDESRKEALQYFWDNSLTDLDVAQRDAAVEQMKRDATRTWMPSSAALAFTRRSR